MIRYRPRISIRRLSWIVVTTLVLWLILLCRLASANEDQTPANPDPAPPGGEDTPSPPPPTPEVQKVVSYEHFELASNFTTFTIRNLKVDFIGDEPTQFLVSLKGNLPSHSWNYTAAKCAAEGSGFTLETQNDKFGFNIKNATEPVSPTSVVSTLPALNITCSGLHLQSDFGFEPVSVVATIRIKAEDEKDSSVLTHIIRPGKPSAPLSAENLFIKESTKDTRFTFALNSDDITVKLKGLLTPNSNEAFVIPLPRSIPLVNDTCTGDNGVVSKLYLPAKDAPSENEFTFLMLSNIGSNTTTVTCTLKEPIVSVARPSFQAQLFSIEPTAFVDYMDSVTTHFTRAYTSDPSNARLWKVLADPRQMFGLPWVLTEEPDYVWTWANWVMRAVEESTTEPPKVLPPMPTLPTRLNDTTFTFSLPEDVRCRRKEDERSSSSSNIEFGLTTEVPIPSSIFLNSDIEGSQYNPRAGPQPILYAAFTKDEAHSQRSFADPNADWFFDVSNDPQCHITIGEDGQAYSIFYLGFEEQTRLMATSSGALAASNDEAASTVPVQVLDNLPHLVTKPMTFHKATPTQTSSLGFALSAAAVARLANIETPSSLAKVVCSGIRIVAPVCVWNGVPDKLMRVSSGWFRAGIQLKVETNGYVAPVSTVLASPYTFAVTRTLPALSPTRLIISEITVASANGGPVQTYIPKDSQGYFVAQAGQLLAIRTGYLNRNGDAIRVNPAIAVEMEQVRHAESNFYKDSLVRGDGDNFNGTNEYTDYAAVTVAPSQSNLTIIWKKRGVYDVRVTDYGLHTTILRFIVDSPPSFVLSLDDSKPHDDLHEFEFNATKLIDLADELTFRFVDRDLLSHTAFKSGTLKYTQVSSDTRISPDDRVSTSEDIVSKSKPASWDQLAMAWQTKVLELDSKCSTTKPCTVTVSTKATYYTFETGYKSAAPSPKTNEEVFEDSLMLSYHAELPPTPPDNNSGGDGSPGDKDGNKDGGEDEKKDGGEDEKKDGGEDEKKDGGEDEKKDGGEDEKKDGGEDEKKDGGEDESKDGGKDENKDGGKDENKDGGKDENKDGGKDENNDGGKNGDNGTDTPTVNASPDPVFVFIIALLIVTPLTLFYRRFCTNRGGANTGSPFDLSCNCCLRRRYSTLSDDASETRMSHSSSRSMYSRSGSSHDHENTARSHERSGGRHSQHLAIEMDDLPPAPQASSASQMHSTRSAALASTARRSNLNSQSPSNARQPVATLPIRSQAPSILDDDPFAAIVHSSGTNVSSSAPNVADIPRPPNDAHVLSLDDAFDDTQFDDFVSAPQGTQTDLTALAVPSIEESAGTAIGSSSLGDKPKKVIKKVVKKKIVVPAGSRLALEAQQKKNNVLSEAALDEVAFVGDE